LTESNPVLKASFHYGAFCNDTAGADLFITLPCEVYVAGAAGSANALDQAEQRIKSTLLGFDYEKQL